MRRLRGLAPRLRTRLPELDGAATFLERGSPARALRKDKDLEQLHWSTTRTRDWPQVLAFAFDHRSQLEALADQAGTSREHIPYFKKLALAAARRAAGDRPDFGVLIDGRYGEDALAEAEVGAWIGRAIELPGSRPLRFDGRLDPGSLREWPTGQCVKCLVFYHPDDPASLREEQERQVLTLVEACRGTGHELLLEVIADKAEAPSMRRRSRGRWRDSTSWGFPRLVEVAVAGGGG